MELRTEPTGSSCGRRGIEQLRRRRHGYVVLRKEMLLRRLEIERKGESVEQWAATIANRSKLLSLPFLSAFGSEGEGKNVKLIKLKKGIRVSASFL